MSTLSHFHLLSVWRKAVQIAPLWLGRSFDHLNSYSLLIMKSDLELGAELESRLVQTLDHRYYYGGYLNKFFPQILQSGWAGVCTIRKLGFTNNPI